MNVNGVCRKWLWILLADNYSLVLLPIKKCHKNYYLLLKKLYSKILILQCVYRQATILKDPVQAKLIPLMILQNYLLIFLAVKLFLQLIVHPVTGWVQKATALVPS